ncbi:aspartyl-phosphate phosphatase Spo0E family protein [Acidilutibacter cellobiosedens]|uniref:Aspartyl-phosphate phosphatase Spo0E family protein n=1 Tax=Acidilutibacter cellobiosedens TaxID=2507161 RepID=A0A410QHN2_9FIRM|nr:aspartyl-phosphate phosphatase Spo0E family protein [Tissierellaceae bacterium]QAT63471.1 aspartyl-phosphate phosphatase Spo0E family protein [Acidilutibacter cellobiosedens]
MKVEIEKKREELNNLMVCEIDKYKILDFSQKLDKLIFQYYKFRENEKSN